jgi:hypothetical protein
MQEMEQPRATFVLQRGQYDQPREQVAAGVPSILPPLPGDAPNNRLGLARWLVDPAHPLTARVAVNHLWQHLFGAGLVRTPENFGTSGEAPTHPELLDWLASQLVRSGWSRKALIRTIVLSSAYRQSSRHRPELKDKDPDNRLLARQERFRVEAEVVRDGALAAAGLLDRRRGGPSVVPPFPRELATGQFTAEALRMPTKDYHRRSIYVHVQRTLTHPVLGAFDVADGNQPCTRRARSATPVQALSLLNDPTFLECARALGRRLQKVAGPDERIAAGFCLVLGRPPSADERAILAELVQRQKAAKATDEQVWAGLARVLLNLEEATTRE